MPLLTSAKPFQPAVPFQTPQDYAERHNLFAKRQTAMENGDTLTNVLRAPPAVFLSMIDTFAESFGLLEDDELEDYLNRQAPEFGRFFQQNREAIGFAGDLAGLFIPATIAARAVRTTSTLAKIAEKTLGPGSRKFFSTGKSNQQLFEEVSERAGVIARQRGRDFTKDLEFIQLRRKALGRSVADVAIESAAADLAIAASMHSSDFLFPEEMSLMDNIKFFGISNVAIGGAAYAAARFTLRNQLQRTAGPLAAMAQNPGKIPLSEAQSLPDARGPSVTVHAAMLEDILLERRGALEAGEQELVANTRAEEEAIKKSISKILQGAFNDNPLEGVTSRQVLKEGPEPLPEMETLQSFLALNPNGLQGLRSLEFLTPGSGRTFESNFQSYRLLKKQNIKDLKAKVDTLSEKLDKARVPKDKDVQRLEDLQNELAGLERSYDDDLGTSGIIVEIDGATSLPAKRSDIFQDGPRDIQVLPEGASQANVEKNSFSAVAGPDGRVRFKKRGVKSKETPEQKAKRLGEFSEFEKALEQEFQQFPHGAEALDELDMIEHTAVFDILQKTAERINPRTFKGFTLDEDAHFTQLDFILRLADEHGADITRKIRGVDPEDLDELEFRSLDQKFREFQKLKMKEAKEFKASPTFQRAILNGSRRFISAHDFARRLNLPADDHAILKLFEASVDNNQVLPLTSIARNMDEVKQALKATVDALPDEPLNPGLRVRGPMMNLPRTRRPVLTVQRSLDPGIDTVSRASMLEHVQALRETVQSRLRGSNTAIVRQVMEEIETRPDQVRAFKSGIHELMQGNDPSGKVMSTVVSQAFRNRGLPGFRAVDELTSIIQKASDQKIDQLLKGPKAAFSRIVEGKHKGDLVTFFTARTALGAGWDVKPLFTEMKGSVKSGQYGIPLKNTDRNKDLWQRLFNEDMPDGDVFLPITGSKGDPVVVTELGRAALEGFDELGQQLLVEVNSIRHAKGMPAIAKKDLHLPPRDMSGQNVVYLADDSGKIITAVSAPTKQEATRKAQEEAALASQRLTVIDESVERLHFESKMQAFFDMVDFSRPSKQTGPAKGRQFGEKIEVSSREFQGMIEQLIRGFKDIERETRTLVFQPEIDFLKFQKAAGSLNNETNTVYDRLINRIMGTQNLDASTLPGHALLWAGSTYDRLMQNIFDKVSPTMAQLPIRKVFAKREFQQVNEALDPQFNPFNDFNDFLEKTADIRLPGELRKHAGALNEITTALTIRMFDVGMGVINTLSLATTLPPVVKMLQPTKDELTAGPVGLAGWKDRIAAWGAGTPGGVGMFSPTRAITSGVHFMFSEEGRQLAKKAKDAGFFDQFAAEQVEIFARTGEKFIPGLLRNFAKKTSVITDRTEILARQVSFMTFLNIGKKGLNLDDHAAFSFAHAQANNVIADFRPSNRPVIFQGAAGMPIGLFTTFMWNYLQRMYSIVESKNMRALINQVGLQSFFFGAESVPGMQEYINFASSNYDGSENLVDRLHKAIGPENAEFFLNGSLSSVTGLSLGPRAAVGVPFSQGLSAQAVPGLRLGGRAIETMWKTIDSIRQERGLNADQIASIVAQSGLNKGVSNAIELYQGYALDRSGNIIESNTRSAIGIGSRLAGFKPLYADELREENRRNRVTDRKRTALKERLGDQLKALVRAGKLTPENVDQALSDYVRAGGSGDNFRRFFTSQVTRGTFSKLDLEIAKALRQSADENRMARLLFLSEQ